MKYLRLVLKVFWKALFYYTFYLWPYARHPSRYPLEVRYRRVRELLIFATNLYNIDWHIEGVEHLQELNKKKQCFLLVSNHLSDLDAMSAVYYCERPITFIAKKEAAAFPLIGTAIKAIDGVFLDRQDLRQNVRAMQKVEKNLADGVCSYLIYPEGTRNRFPLSETATFHPGSFKPAFKTNCPIICLATYGTQRPFHPNTDYHRYPLFMKFFAPLPIEDYSKYTTTDVSIWAHETIASEVYKMRARDAYFFLEDKEHISLRKGKVEA
jgi:1-acyl-sn-glycerol-3-phosphate acyltransferase